MHCNDPLTVLGMGFEGLVMTVSVREFLFDGIKIGSTGWMIGLKSDGTQEDVTAITARLPITVFDPKNGFALFNHKNDTMENEWYEVGVAKEKALNFFEHRLTLRKGAGTDTQ